MTKTAQKKERAIKAPLKASKRKKQVASPPRDTTHLWGLALFVFAFSMLISALSFAYLPSTNLLGLVGSGLGSIGHSLFGLSCYVVCLFAGWGGWRLMFHKSIAHPLYKSFWMGILVISLCMILNLIEHNFPTFSSFLRNTFYPSLVQRRQKYHLGGAPLYYLYLDLPSLNFNRSFSSIGVGLIFTSTLIASWMCLAKFSLSQFLQKLAESFRKTPSLTPLPAASTNDARLVGLKIPKQQTDSVPFQHLQDHLSIRPETNLKVRPSISQKASLEPPSEPRLSAKTTSQPSTVAPPVVPQPPPPPATSKPVKKREVALAAQKVHNGDFTDFILPPAGLLTAPKKVDQNSLKKDLRRQAEVLEETLQSFGIQAKVGQINCGPTITSFEVHPSIGVKVQKIKTLENDIALNMEAKSLRIIAPIPGKAAVGIEVPNPQPQEVAFKDMLLAYQQSGRKLHIPILLGKAVNGDDVVSDLTKMPHCIIAGATGSGKSVCINTIVMSIVMNAKPDEIKLIMIDPKKVELTPYTRLPHMLAPVITEPLGACAALNWLVKEMENRYDILKLFGTRNIEAFNNRVINKDFEAALDREIPARLPYFVGIIDELADLMMVASSDIETPIARIAQMARAVGIHLILATQRPSREVITGIIKANFPTRISFKVASRVNSQIVLDEVGAETLLGNGDMLFLPPGTSHLIRAQGAFIRDQDINDIIKHICDQAPPNYKIESFDKLGAMGGVPLDSEDDDLDALYPEAMDIVKSSGNASTTFLQRKLKVGYARAASLIDQLEQQGIISAAEGSKPRKILVKPEKDKEIAQDSHGENSLEDFI